MAINALQVAWISRLADKKIIRQGDSILEFGPQDLICQREAVKKYGLRHRDAATVRKALDEAYDGERPRPVIPSAFYGLFGIERYRSLDLTDKRANWLRDCNMPFRLPERFDVITNFGTAEHVFNIAALFQSVHDALKPGGVALHVLPAFGDIDHGFYNIHPTTYLDLAAANEYEVEDLCYVDRWDIRNRILEENLVVDFDFESVPIKIEHLRDRAKLQRMVVDLYVANYSHPKTRQYGPNFPGYVYDYCIAALRKKKAKSFRLPIQGYYAGGIGPSSKPRRYLLHRLLRRFMVLSSPMAIVKAKALHRAVSFLPYFVRRRLVRSILTAVVRDLTLNVTGIDLGISLLERWIPFVITRPTYPTPPLSTVATDQMMTLVESRIQWLYKNAQPSATISDIDLRFLSKVSSALTSDFTFVSFIRDRYRNEKMATPDRKKVTDDILNLLRRR